LCVLGFIAERLLTDGALQRHRKPRDTVFENVVGRSLLNAFNGGFFS
jgi:hypothetical protein